MWFSLLKILGATIVVLRTRMETDRIEPAFFIQKNLELKFVFLYSKYEFSESFVMLGKNSQRLAPLITKKVSMAKAKAKAEAEAEAVFKALSGNGE